MGFNFRKLFKKKEDTWQSRCGWENVTKEKAKEDRLHPDFKKYSVNTMIFGASNTGKTKQAIEEIKEILENNYGQVMICADSVNLLNYAMFKENENVTMILHDELSQNKDKIFTNWDTTLFLYIDNLEYVSKQDKKIITAICALSRKYHVAATLIQEEYNKEDEEIYANCNHIYYYPCSRWGKRYSEVNSELLSENEKENMTCNSELIIKHFFRN